HPHPIRIDVLLPRQIVAAVAVEPFQHRRGKLLRSHRLNSPFNAFFNSGLTLSPSFSSIFSLSLSPAILVATWPRRSLSTRQALAPSSSGPRQRSGHSMPTNFSP